MFSGVDRYFPLVIHIERGVVTEADVDAMRGFYRTVHERAAPYLHLVDGRGATMPSSVVRKQLSDFALQTMALTRQYQIANAITLDSRVGLGVMTALRWVVPAPVPEKYFSAIADAFAWLEVQGAAHGVTVLAARAHIAELHGAGRATIPTS